MLAAKTVAAAAASRPRCRPSPTSATMLAAQRAISASSLRRPLSSHLSRRCLAAARTSTGASASAQGSSATYNKKGRQQASTSAGFVAAAAATAAVAVVTFAADSNAACESESSQSSNNAQAEDGNASDQPKGAGAVTDLLDINEPARFARCLAYHRVLRPNYALRWDWANEGSRLPTTAWPLHIPDEADVPGLTADLRYCRRSPNYRNDEEYCDRLRFRIASFGLLQPDLEGQKKGLKIVRDLAERGHADGMCLYGMCLNDGRAGLEPNPQKAVVWFRLASDMHFHEQATYELGVALYTGEGIAEDEAAAARKFRRAADTGHAAAAYMLGDCLLDGVGVVRDRAEALEWLVTAAELGHRGARSRVLAVLDAKDGDDYGKFTDSSRQTLVESVPIVVDDDATMSDEADCTDAGADDNGGVNDANDQEVPPTPPNTPTNAPNSSSDTVSSAHLTAEQRDQSEGRFQARHASFERRYTIGGGARNPVVLARRRTIIKESRDE